MTRTARPNRDTTRSTKTLPASTWNSLKLPSEFEQSSYKFGDTLKHNKVSSDNKKQVRSEERRVKRVVTRESGKVCFNCRGAGHMAADCPEVKDSVDQGSGICYKCGSTEHSLSACRVKVADGELPFAKCFICKEMGHLSKACPDNPRGLYPMGGGCDICGSVEHFKKDCSETKLPGTGNADITLDTLNADTNVDEEPSFAFVAKPKPNQPTVKVVKF